MLSKKSLFSVLFFMLFCTQVFAYDLKYSAEILLNGEPSAVAVNPSADTAVAVSRSGLTLTVVDLATAAVIHEIPLAEAPVGLALHQASNRAVVATETGRIIFFDFATGQVARTVETGAAIHTLAVDEHKGMLLIGTGEGVLQVNLADLSLLPESLLAGEVIHIAPGKSSCAVVGKDNEAVWLNTLGSDGQQVKEAALPGEPAGLGLDEPLGILLTIEKNMPGVRLYDLVTLEPAGEIPIQHPAQGLAVNPSTHRAYLADGEGNLSVIDLVGKSLVERVHLFEQTGPLAVDPARNVALVGHGSNLAVVQLENPVPTLTGIVPEESPAGSEGVQISLTGAKFIRDSSTRFDEQPLATGFEDNENLVANITPSELELPGDVAVAVRNPPPGGGESNRLTFKILTPMPQLSALSPEKVAVGSPAMTLRVDGKNFLPSSTVHLGGSKVETRFVSSTVLEALVPSSFLAAEASHPVSVINPGNVALSSNAFNLLVVPEDELPTEEASALSNGAGSLTGRILNTEMWPVKGVTIKIRGLSTRTNANGEFRLDGIPAGKRVVLMDGSTAEEADGHYPTIPITVDIVANTVNSMPFQPYMHRQKARNFVNIDPARDTILTDPEVPGFEMRIPAGVNITGWDGKRNLKVSVRTVPIDRLPVKPLPKNAHARTVYMFFFDKVGGGVADRPIPIKAKNDLGLLPGEKAILWYFDESHIEGMAPNDWAIAGTGTVTSDGKYIVTDPGVGIPKFCCGATAFGGSSAGSPPSGSSDSEGCGDNNAGDPVNLATGYFMHEKTDYKVDGTIPVEIKRYYRSGDNGLGGFGRGTFFGYDWWLGVYPDMLLLLKPGNYQYRFVKQPDGTFVNESDPAYQGDVFYKNADNTYTLNRKDGWSYKFGTSRLLDEIRDPAGHTLTFYKEIDGNISRIVMADGREIHISYQIGGISGRDIIRSITGPNGTVTYSYAGKLTSVQYPDGSAISYEYDTSGRMTKITENGKIVVTNIYDANNRVTTQTHPDGGTYNFNYTSAGGYISETDMTAPNGSLTTWRFYDDSGVYRDGYIVKKTTPDGATIYEREAGSNLVSSITDPLGRKTSYTYDARGRRLSKTDPAGNTTSYQYEDACNKVTRITDALGKSTDFAYTFASGTCRLTRTEIRDPLQNLTVIEYDGNGMPVRITDPNNNATTFAYDPAHPDQLASASDPLGNTVRYGYDDLGRVTNVTDAKGAATTYEYDGLTDRVKIVTDPLGNQTRYAYALTGNLTTVIDPRGNLIHYEYDDRDRITRMTDQLGREEIYTYYRDAEITPITGDNLKSITDRKGQVTTFDEYDPMGRLKQVTYGDGSTTQYAYDAGGRVTAITDSLSGLITYAYNDFGCGNCSGVGVDRIAEETTSAGTVAYTYNKVGRRITMDVPGAPEVSYGYDDAGRLININRNIGGSAKDFAIAYDPAGRRTSVQLPLYRSKGKWYNLTSTYGYDVANHLTSLLHESPAGVIESFTWTYDPNGNRKSVGQSASIPLATPLADTSYDEANEMLSYDSAALTYDLNGNLESRTDTCGTTIYTWDGRNRLTGISGFHEDCTPLSASYSYDALNRRIERTVDGVTAQYVYDGWDIIQETTGGVVTNYTRTLNIDEPLAFERSDSTVRYYKADAQGSVIALTDGNGVVTTTYAYDAFGNATVSGSDINPFQYTGRENDETELYYYRARYYSPQMRRFISEDPIRLAGGSNYFAYVQNNPVNFVDPLGLWSIFGGAGGQAGFHAGFVGINGSSTAMMGTDQQGCVAVTVCLRIGPGLYAGAGGLLQAGGARNNTQDVGGWSIGLGGDIGYGPSMGGQITGSTSALVAGKGKWGGGGGISGGIDFCWTEVKCTDKCQDK